MALEETVLQQLDPKVRSYIEELQTKHDSLSSQHRDLEVRYEVLDEKYRLLLFKRFARSSEQDSSQQQLFEEAEQTAEAESESEDTAETVTVTGYQRSKKGRKPIDETVPRTEYVHDIDKSEKQCACGHEMVRIGEEVTERMQVIPAQFFAERHIRPKYACRHCEGSGDEDKPAVRVAPAPPSILPGSIATPGLLAFILVNKFVDHLPFYRQEVRFGRLGIHISRQNMSNWAIGVAKKLAPLIKLFEDRIRGGPFIQMDETPVQVLREPERPATRKSYMWLARGGPPEASVCLYHYAETRGPEYAQSLLEDYTGFVQADAYDVYARIAEAEPGITLVGCWAHARRKFHEASKASKKVGAAHEAVSRIKKLYQVEKELRAKDLDATAFLSARKKQVEPVLESFKQWLAKKSETVVPSSLLGRAVAYTLKEWDKLVRYLDAPGLTPDNNAAERAIRPFVLGRKNWLFSGSPSGATSSCAIYSIIETGKQNGFDPYAYLHYIFAKAPLMTDEVEWESLLPENLEAEHVNKAFLAALR